MITEPHRNPQFIQRCAGYGHQTEMLDKTWDLKHYALFWEMGLGKTKTTIETAALLYLGGEIDGLLVIAPKGGYLNWPLEEVPKHMPEGIPYRSAFYSSHMRKDERSNLLRIMRAEDNMLDVMAINVEAISSSAGFTAACTFLQSHHGMCVVDESIFIKSPFAKRTKSAMALGRMAEYRRILSGAPMTQNPLDLFAQMEFLQKGLSKHASYFSFRGHYANMVSIQTNGRTFPKIVGFTNLPELTRHLMTFSDRRLKTECLDLPEKIFETVYVEWTPEQERAYTTLKQEALVDFAAGTMSSTSALTTLMRLHQINCGHIKLDDEQTMDIPSNRLQTLLDLIESISGKIIIWARFRDDIRQIVAELRREHGERSTVHYYGSTNQLERIESLHRFKNDKSCRFLVANAASAGRSLTLIEATTAIYYSMSYSLEEYLQSQDRNHRIGQTRTVTYLTLAVPDTVDVKLIRALQSKNDLAARVLDNFRQLLA